MIDLARRRRRLLLLAGSDDAAWHHPFVCPSSHPRPFVEVKTLLANGVGALEDGGWGARIRAISENIWVRTMQAALS